MFLAASLIFATWIITFQMDQHFTSEEHWAVFNKLPISDEQRQACIEKALKYQSELAVNEPARKKEKNDLEEKTQKKIENSEEKFSGEAN